MMNAFKHLFQKNKPVPLFSLLAIMAIILAACAPAATPASTPEATQPVSTQSVSSPASVTIDVASDPTLGKFLVDSSGKTLYIFTKDTPDTSNCNASCQANWPLLATSGIPKAGPGVDASLLGVATLANGEKIVTYDKHPLYYVITDQKAGDKTGEGYKSLWYVISPSGQPIMPASPSSSTATPAASAATATPVSSPATPAATQAMISEPTIDVAKNSSLGDILVANNGMTLYAYTADAPDTSNCSAGCQKVWWPLLTLGHPNLGTGVTTSMIANTKLADGTLIVTYNHMPLYYFVNDTASGQTNGQGFDNVWFAVSPDGKMVGKVSEVTIDVTSNPILGSYLVGPNGQAIYAYGSDTANTSICTGACAANWPPVITLGKPTLGSGIDTTMIGTIKLSDGSLLLTYNSKPLYYFVADSKSGDVKGQGIKNLWYVLGPDGNPITYLLPKPITAEPTINVGDNATYGQILTDGNGMTLYVNINDLKGESVCFGKCMQDWAPLFTLGHPMIGSGVNSSLVGTQATSYGMMIVTYNGRPLYLFKNDKNPGEVNGEDANISWYVISVAGQPVTKR